MPYRICEFCRCGTNAALRMCCDKGREADKKNRKTEGVNINPQRLLNCIDRLAGEVATAGYTSIANCIDDLGAVAKEYLAACAAQSGHDFATAPCRHDWQWHTQERINKRKFRRTESCAICGETRTVSSSKDRTNHESRTTIA